MNNDRYHDPVLVSECIAGLDIRQLADGTYVDCTFGGGGHSKAILAQLSADGHLIGMDQDEHAARNVITDTRFTFIRGNFQNIESHLKRLDVIPVDGILADLGVSSHHIDTAERGFSTRHDGPLDMRMNRNAELTAAQVVNEYPEEKLADVIKAYGEMPGRRIVRALVQSRPIHTTKQLRDAAAPFAGRLAEKFFAKLFQAIRIEVNGELEALKALLEQSVDVLKQGGRLAVISYHSLEDRLVKNYMLRGTFSGDVRTDHFGNPIRPFKPITKKPIVAKGDELLRNPRARSARLRIAEKH